MECYEVGDYIHGYRTGAKARKISDPTVWEKRKAQGSTTHPDGERRGDCRKKAGLDTNALASHETHKGLYFLLAVESSIKPKNF